MLTTNMIKRVTAAALVATFACMATPLCAADAPAAVPALMPSTTTQVGAVPAAPGQELVCHRQKEMGSYIVKRVCRTRAAEAAALRGAGSSLDRLNQAGNTSRGDTPTMVGTGDAGRD